MTYSGVPSILVFLHPLLAATVVVVIGNIVIVDIVVVVVVTKNIIIFIIVGVDAVMATVIIDHDIVFVDIEEIAIESICICIYVNQLYELDKLLLSFLIDSLVRMQNQCYTFIVDFFHVISGSV